jgi:hypothetical protein
MRPVSAAILSTRQGQSRPITAVVDLLDEFNHSDHFEGGDLLRRDPKRLFERSRSFYDLQ